MVNNYICPYCNLQTYPYAYHEGIKMCQEALAKRKNMINLEGKRVLVTGAGSMLGREIVKVLEKRGAISLQVFRTQSFNIIDNNIISCDLLEQEHTVRLFDNFYPIDMVINGCGVNGNIGYNLSHPATIFGETLYMNMNILGCSTLNKVSKIVNLLSSCAYEPKEILEEKDFLSGTTDESVESHGLARKGVFAYGKFLNKQYGLNSVGVVLNNCYGYAAFDRPHKLKVADNLVKKFVDAKYNNDKEVVVWGTGNPLRELLFCEDAAEGVVKVLEHYEDNNEVINIGGGKDISIINLANLIKELVGFEGKIVLDTSKADGQMKKLLCNKKMREVLGWEPPTSLKEGLKLTIQHYTDNYVEKSKELVKV